MSAVPFEPASNQRNYRGRIRWLVGGHVAAMCLLLTINHVWPLRGVDLAGNLEFAQLNLLAIWFALGRGRWQSRLLKSLTGAALVATAKEGISGVLFPHPLD
jgi:hypothetical protein